MYKEIEADLVELFWQGEFDVIAHGCNCFNTMKSGIAGAIAKKFPTVSGTDIAYTNKGDINKLGGYSLSIQFLKEEIINKYGFKTNKTGKIYNLYTQYNYGRDKKLYLNYDALALCLYKLNFTEKGKKIGLPGWIGCGLAGGNIDKVKKIIQNNLTDCDVTICCLN